MFTHACLHIYAHALACLFDLTHDNLTYMYSSLCWAGCFSQTAKHSVVGSVALNVGSDIELNIGTQKETETIGERWVGPQRAPLLRN